MPITLNEYQEKAKETAEYPKEHNWIYPAIGLANEAGEVLGIIKRGLRGDYKIPENINGPLPDGYDLIAADIAKELGDVLWYLAITAKEYGYTLEQIAQINLDKLADRKERGVIKGTGDNR